MVASINVCQWLAVKAQKCIFEPMHITVWKDQSAFKMIIGFVIIKILKSFC